MTIDIDAALARAREHLRPRSKEEQEEARIRQLEEAMLVARVLDNDGGRALLELLWRKFGAPVEFDPAQGFENGAALGFYRSGQTVMLNWVGSMIERARVGGKPATRTPAPVPPANSERSQDETGRNRPSRKRSRRARSQK